MTDDMDARSRVKRLEAENARLRNVLEQVNTAVTVGASAKDVLMQIVLPALHATPPPESEPDDRVMDNRGRMWPAHGACPHCGGMGEMHGPGEGDGECPKCSGTGKAPHTPEQTGGRMIDTESIDERFAQFERRGEPDRHPTLEFGSVALERFIHDMMREINRLRALQSNREPEQTGDALAALERIRDRRDKALPEDFETVRRHLTASGVPYPINVVFDGPPSATSGRFVEVETDDGRSVRVGEWIERGDGLWSLRIDCSGVPYVPEEVRRLPEGWRKSADAKEDGRTRTVPISQYTYGRADQQRIDADELASALASAPAVPSEWQQPAWRPIDTYPKDDGKYRNGTRCWLWHEDLGVCWGFMDDLPSGFRCDLFQNRRGVWEVVAAGVKAARKVHCWMPPAPAMPEPPIAAAPTDGRE